MGTAGIACGTYVPFGHISHATFTIMPHRDSLGCLIVFGGGCLIVSGGDRLIGFGGSVFIIVSVVIVWSTRLF